MDIYVSVIFSFSKIGSDNRWDWPKAQFPTPLGFEPLDVSLFKGLFLSIRGSIKTLLGLEQKPDYIAGCGL